MARSLPKDLALLRLREDLRRYAPELAPRFEAVAEQDGALARTRP